MKSELVMVWRISLSKADLEDAIKTYIEVYHDPPLTLTDDCETGPIFQAGMLDGYKVGIGSQAMAPDQIFNDFQSGYKPDEDKADSITNIDWDGGTGG